MPFIGLGARCLPKTIQSHLLWQPQARVSQAPALHLGRLVNNAKNHLGKIAQDKPKLAFWFEDRIAEIASRIGDAAPRTLTLEEQSLFALGYYQQLAQLRAGKGDKPASDSSNAE